MRLDWRVVKKGLNSVGLHHREDELSSAWFIKSCQLLPKRGILFYYLCTSESPNLLASQTVPFFLIPKTPHLWLLVGFLFCYIKDYSFYWNNIFFFFFFFFFFSAVFLRPINQLSIGKHKLKALEIIFSFFFPPKVMGRSRWLPEKNFISFFLKLYSWK